MDALVMCGGRGTRLDADREKPLVRVGGQPMVDRVRDALAASRAATTYAAVSPHAPATRAHLADADCRLVETPGEGYVADLDAALDAVGRPALTVAADLPLLAPAPVDRTLAAARDGERTRPLAVHVPAALKRALSASVDRTVERDGRELAPTGLNVVADGTDAVRVSHDVRLAVNVNRPTDRDLAEALCG